MRFDATFPLQSAIRRNSGGFASALVLILAALLVAAHPARAAGPQAQPAAKQPRNARPVANQTAPPNAAATPNAVPEQSAAQTAAPIAEPVLRQNLVQDPFRVAIDQAVQKGKQEAATKPATTPATPIAPGNAAPSTSPNATTNAPQNTSPNASPNTNATSSGPPAVNGATNPNQPAAARLVCQGTRPATGAAYTLMFDPNANPAPAAGDACIPTGQPKAVGQAVMSSAPKTGPALAVVVPSTPTGGGNTSAAGSASERLVCQGTRPATGAAYTLLFDPNANPAPAAGDACIPTGQPKAVGQAVMSSAPKTGPALAVVVPSTPAGGGNTSAAGSASARLVCQGTRPATGAAYTLMFDPNANPAPAAGDACIPTGQPKAVGQAVMSSAPKTGPALAVVVPSTPAGGANTNAAGPASQRLVCQGTRPATGAAYTLLFDPNANPAPAAGDACIPTGQKMAKGTAVMSSQKTTGPALAVVFVPPSTAGGGNTSAAGSASARLVCQGTRPATGAAFTLLFDPNASPAPAAGDACIPSGQKMAKGTAVMSSQKTTGPALAVVFVPPTKAGGANTGAAGPAAATLVCKGTRVNGAAFTFPFAANTSPAPAPGDACVPSGKKMPKGTAVMGTAPKAAKVFAVVFVPPTSHNTK